jgi:hypothetical protein
MASLSSKIIQYVGRTVDFQNEVRLHDNSDGNGPFIKYWNVTGKSQPTLEELNVFETIANDYEYNQGQIEKRQIEYGSPSEQMEFITENGLTAWQTKVTEIKTRFPKR